MKRIISVLLTLCLVLTAAAVLPASAGAAAQKNSVTLKPNGVMVTWAPVKEAEEYYVLRALPEEDEWTYLAAVTSTAYCDTTAVSGTEYCYSVSYLCDDDQYYVPGYDDYGEEILYIAAPKITKFENTVSGTQITWNKVKGAAGYRVYVKNGASWKKLGDTTANTYLNKAVTANVKYTYTIRAINQKGAFLSSFYAAGKSYKFLAAPASPSLERTADGVKITWKKSLGAAKYRVFRKTASTKWRAVGDTSAGVRTFTDNSVKDNTAYEYTVRCMTADASAYTSGFHSGSKITVVKAPKITKRENAVKGTQLTWSKVKGAAKYRVYVKSGSSWKKLADTTANTYLNTAVKAGTKYTYTVRALNAKGAFLTFYNTEGWSHRFIAAPAAPALKNTASGVQITWKKSAGAAKYRVFRKTASTKWTAIADTDGLSWLDDSVKNGTAYSYTVRCITADGGAYTSGWLAGSSITVKGVKNSDLNRLKTYIRTNGEEDDNGYIRVGGYADPEVSENYITLKIQPDQKLTMWCSQFHTGSFYTHLYDIDPQSDYAKFNVKIVYGYGNNSETVVYVSGTINVRSFSDIGNASDTVNISYQEYNKSYFTLIQAKNSIYSTLSSAIYNINRYMQDNIGVGLHDLNLFRKVSV